MTFSPKEDFSKGATAAQWTEIASSRVFIQAASAALLHMQQLQARVLTVEEASSNCFRMEGAREFLSTLMNLTTPPREPRKPIASENLDHSV